MSTGKWMIYGANGYTGEITAHEAKRRGLSPILAGRRATAIEPIAKDLGFESRIFAVDDLEGSTKALEDIDAVLHCAGPFSATSKPMLEACVGAKTHYTDITGEIDVFEYAHQNDKRWAEAGIIAMPGVGFDVVPSDCLAAMLKRKLPSATHLQLAFRAKHGGTSPGTTKTMVEGIHEGGKIRKDGKIIAVPAAYKVEEIPFGCGVGTGVTIPWGDVSTAYYSTGIPNIEVFMGMPASQAKQMKRIAKMGWLLGSAPAQSFLKWMVGVFVKGPSAEARANDNMYLWGEVRDDDGNVAAMTMTTPEGYDLTVSASIAAVTKLLEMTPKPGAYTPSMAFGANFVTELEGVEVQELTEA